MYLDYLASVHLNGTKLREFLSYVQIQLRAHLFQWVVATANDYAIELELLIYTAFTRAMISYFVILIEHNVCSLYKEYQLQEGRGIPKDSRGYA